MCGFAAIFDLENPRPIRRSEIERITRTLAHRGPDGEGFHLEPGVAMGFRRLAIIDLEGGNQPMTGCDGRVWLIFNGEIYNFRELRAQLAKLGHTFKTRSDSEVIVHAYEEWGEECPERLRGIFAFCIFDRRRKRVFLARDRSGVKPLYVSWRGTELRVASEIKALLAGRGATRQIDLGGYLGLRGLSSGLERTPFVGVQELAPAHSATITHKGTVTRRYWRYQPTVELGGKGAPALVSALRAKLEAVVEMQEVADVPIGAYLSGGVDSAAVVALMAQRRRKDLRTYTTRFASGASEDPLYAKILAEELQLDARFVETDLGAASATLLPRIAWLAEGRFDLGWVARFALARSAAAGGIKVILTGQGIDEILSGYFASFQALLRDTLLGDAMLRTRPLGVPALPLVSDGALLDMAGRAHGRTAPAAEAELAAARLESDHDGLAYLLRFEDRMGMAAGVEVRVPMLDHEILELCASIPQRLRSKLLSQKRILREAVRPFLPEKIVERPKYAFNSNSASLTSVVLASGNEELRWLLSPEAAKEKGYFVADWIAPLLKEAQHYQLNDVFLVHLLDELFVSRFDPDRFVDAAELAPGPVPDVVPPSPKNGAPGPDTIPRVGRTVRRLSTSFVTDPRTGKLEEPATFVEFVEATRPAAQVPPDAVELLARMDGQRTYRQLAEELGEMISLEGLLEACGALAELGIVEHVT